MPSFYSCNDPTSEGPGFNSPSAFLVAMQQEKAIFNIFIEYIYKFRNWTYFSFQKETTLWGRYERDYYLHLIGWSLFNNEGSQGLSALLEVTVWWQWKEFIPGPDYQNQQS